MITRFLVIVILLLQLSVVRPEVLTAQKAAVPPASEDQAALHLAQAIMCGSIDNFKPVNLSAVYPVSQGTVMCFTDFDVVPRETALFHVWIKRDALVYRKRLILKPPRWASVSSIKLREADKGPWRVEIRDASGRLLETLRFSITE